jgi:flagellar protein FliS
MTLSNPYRQYQTTQVQTAGPAQLTLMCYDGALRFISQGREALLARRFEAKHAALDKAQALLAELLKGLDFERGGVIARDLDALYRYLYDRLSHANIRDDQSALDEVRGHLIELRTAWSSAMTSAAAAATGAAPAAPAPPGAAPARPELALSA